MASIKGVALSVRLDEFKIDATPNGPKASIRTSFFAEFDSKTNKASYNRVIFTTKSKYRIEQLAALNLPAGRLDQDTRIHLTIPFSNLHFNLWQGQQGPGQTGWAYIDGEVTVAIPAPKPAQNNGQRANNADRPARQETGGYPAVAGSSRETTAPRAAAYAGNDRYRSPWEQ